VSAMAVDPLTAGERARVAARWQSAEDFYAERDDRTRRGVGEVAVFAIRPIEIWVDPVAAGEVTVQRIALVAANLTARWARRVRVVLPDNGALATPLRRDGATTLKGRLHSEMTLADPFGHWILGARAESSERTTGAEPLRLFVGPWSAESGAAAGAAPSADDYRVDARSWSALGVRGEGDVAQKSGVAPATVPAAALAGALGAADLFKRAAGHSAAHWMPTFVWDTWTHTLTHGPHASANIVDRHVPTVIDLGRTLLAGAGAIGSAFVYLADLAPLTGALTLFDRDRIEVTNLNRSPAFTVLHALDQPEKPYAMAAYLAGRGIAVIPVTGVWREKAAEFAAEPFDVWVSLTNEDGAWAEVPFALPPVVLHGTTTSGWGFGVGRHVPRLEDCTLCRMPRPQAEFRGPCAEGDVNPATGERADREAPRASLPFLSVAAAALLLAERMKLDFGTDTLTLPNDVAADLGVGLPAVVALLRRPSSGCRGCRASQSGAWAARLAGGRYDNLSFQAASAPAVG
jgi:hypothetical protein